MDDLWSITSGFLLLMGSFFAVVGGIGIVRLPDFYTRLHGGGMTDTLGAGLVLIGLMFESGFTLTSAKLAMILALLLICSPTSCHALAQSAISEGLHPLLAEKKES